MPLLDDIIVFCLHTKAYTLCSLVAEEVMNEEVGGILQYCATNKLSINAKKTKFMLITSPQKRIRNIKVANFEQKIIENIWVYILIGILLGNIRLNMLIVK